MIITTPAALAQVAKNARKAKGMTQQDVADLVGVKQKTVSAFENHPEGTRIDTLFRLLSALELECLLEPRDKTSLGDTRASAWTEEW